jgi:hypothetical protein
LTIKGDPELMRNMNRVEIWRRNQNLNQRAVAEKIGATDAVVVSAEKGRPIQRVFIDAYVRVGAGFLLETDFLQAAIHKPEGGSTHGDKEKGRRKGRHAGRR